MRILTYTCLVALGLTTLLSGKVVAQQGSAGKDIVTTAVEAGSFKTLAAALQAADLVKALQGEGALHRVCANR